MPDVTIIVPVYDGRPWLDLQVHSILRQSTEWDFELVLADNGSSDGSADDARAYAAEHPRVRFVDASARPGNAACRNLGAKDASSPVVVFTDQDDICDETWLDRLMEVSSETTISGGAIVYIESDASTPAPASGEPPATLGQHPFDYLPFAICTNIAIPTAAFERLGGFDERFPSACDVDFCWRAQESGLTIASAPGAIVFKRRRPPGGRTFSQHRAYAKDDALLFSIHQKFGMRRNWKLTLRQLAWLIANAPGAVRDDSTRRAWLNVAGTRVGRILGSVQHRKFYI